MDDRDKKECCIKKYKSQPLKNYMSTLIVIIIKIDMIKLSSLYNHETYTKINYHHLPIASCEQRISDHMVQIYASIVGVRH